MQHGLSKGSLSGAEQSMGLCMVLCLSAFKQGLDKAPMGNYTLTQRRWDHRIKVDKELVKGECAVGNMKRRLSGGRQISSDVPVDGSQGSV